MVGIRKNLCLCCVFILLFFTGCSVDETEEKEKSHRNDLTLGASARDFLSDESFTSLELEIVYVTGFEPTADAISNLKTFLSRYTHKPGGVTMNIRAIASPKVGTYSIEEIISLEKKHRTVFSEGEKLGAFIFFADNKSVDSNPDRKIIGKAYMNTSMVVFDKEVSELAGTVSREDIQTTALFHEFGHLFGLVNNGSPAQSSHEESEKSKKAHCNVDGCLMAAAIAFSSSPVSFLGDYSSIPDFDDKCKLDLKANGGK